MWTDHKTWRAAAWPAWRRKPNLRPSLEEDPEGHEKMALCKETGFERCSSWRKDRHTTCASGQLKIKCRNVCGAWEQWWQKYCSGQTGKTRDPIGRALKSSLYHCSLCRGRRAGWCKQCQISRGEVEIVRVSARLDQSRVVSIPSQVSRKRRAEAVGSSERGASASWRNWKIVRKGAGGGGEEAR